ncbi:MAG TPA: hypothetical protein ENL34_07570 [Chloroflexi bacterium]|nr:hypothetical protein [Chloroflexota bacterium]
MDRTRSVGFAKLMRGITGLLGGVLLIALLIACQPKELLGQVSVTPSTITPNADGETDVARVEFYLNANADVSFSLLDGQGVRYSFRPPTRLSVRERPYTVYFGGVVEGFLYEDEPDPDYQIVKRVLPDGVYTWELTAHATDGRVAVVTGTLTVREADTTLPGIRGFSVYPKRFSPNQDGIDDRVTINLVLEKDVEELRVYLLGRDGVEHPIAEDERLTRPNEKGWHTFDYDGGIDAGSEPPPDGVYAVYADARDAVGQRVVTSTTLELVNAGMPRAYIVNGEVEYSATSLVLSDTLCFTLTVENDSETYIRTTGPWPGTTYRSDQNFNTLGWSEESGVFRVGMDFDTSLRNYPFRWGIGRPNDNLVLIDGYWYLPPRARSLVTGCVQIVEVPVRNPLYYWMGLIHEDVEIASVNNRVDPNFVTIWEP